MQTSWKSSFSYENKNLVRIQNTVEIMSSVDPFEIFLHEVIILTIWETSPSSNPSKGTANRQFTTPI